MIRELDTRDVPAVTARRAANRYLPIGRMSVALHPWKRPSLFRIFVSREQGLHSLPGEYEDLEDAKQVFEEHHGDVAWCLLAKIEPRTERPVFVFHGVVAGSSVEWKPVA
jgi:hypothetical protein